MRSLQLQGILLFLFIPVVLVLFVVHPEPIALSLSLGVVLMLGHRFLARPYMQRALPAKCLWCNGSVGDLAEPIPLDTAGGRIVGRSCPRHAAPLLSYLTALDRFRWILRLGIFLPLLALLVGLLVTASGRPAPLDTLTAVFRLAVGITVNIAAIGYLWVAPRSPTEVPFPAHNFTLLGVRNLIWIFRLVGVWWIVVGLRYLLTG